MSLPSLESQNLKVEILTEHYQVVGMLQLFGMVSTFLNQHDRINYPITRASFIALDTTSTVAAIQMDEALIRRDEIVVLRILEGDTQGLVQRLPVAEKVRLFVPRFVIQGTTLRGADTTISEVFESQAGLWASVSDTHVHPLTTLRSAVFHEAPLLLINKRHIRFYEKIKEQTTS